MDEPNVDETNPEQSQAQRRWEGSIRVSKSRTDAGESAARVQQLVAEPAPDPRTAAPPRVPSAAQVRAGGRRWQPEPADWTSTVFGIELPHDVDCPLHSDEAPYQAQYETDEDPAAARAWAAPAFESTQSARRVEEHVAAGAFEGEAPAPTFGEIPAGAFVAPTAGEPAPVAWAEARTAPEIEVDPAFELPAADPRHAEFEAPEFETAGFAAAESVEPWFDAPEFLDPEDDEIVGSVVLIPVAEDESAPFEPTAVVPVEVEPVEYEELQVIHAADLGLVAVELEDLAAGRSNSMDDRYTELAVIVPPRSEWLPSAPARVPGSRRESDPFVPPSGIGATLAAARLSAGLTHDQLARITRIGVARLVEFENDDYSGCGADIFARGRLDSIARAVGVDPEPLLQEFDARYGGAHTVTYGVGGRPQIRMPRNWTLVLLCALAVAAIYPVALLVVAVLG